MNKKTSKTVIKIALFTLIFIVLFSTASAILFPKWEGKTNSIPGVSTFYKQPKDSIDALFIGSSSFRNGISPLLLWENYGFTSYDRSTSAQHPIVTYYYLLEALEYQQPKVVILDGINLFSPFDVDVKEPSLRESIDPMKFSKYKLQLVKEITSRSKQQTFISFIFPIFRYHDRWKEITEKDFNLQSMAQYDPYKGQYVTEKISPAEIPSGFMEQSDSEILYDENSRLYFEKTIQLCISHNIPVILVSLPRYSSYNLEKHLGIQEIADKYGLDFIDYNLPELSKSININPAADFSDPNHLNIYGSEKIAINLGEFLARKFNLVDKRDNSAYQQWNNDLGVLQGAMENQ